VRRLVRTKSQSGGGASGGASGGAGAAAEPDAAARAALEAAVQATFQKHESAVLAESAVRAGVKGAGLDVGADAARLASVLQSVAVSIEPCDHVRERLWVLRRWGDGSLDKFRPVLAGLFGKNAKVKRRMVREAILKELGPKDVAVFGSGSVYTRVMKEVAKSSGSVWVLKK
jgi:hypothetical protein